MWLLFVGFWCVFFVSVVILVSFCGVYICFSCLCLRQCVLDFCFVLCNLMFFNFFISCCVFLRLVLLLVLCVFVSVCYAFLIFLSVFFVLFCVLCPALVFCC